MTDVFISYSRKDKVFARRLVDALTQTGRDAWVDWESIPYSAEWWKEICGGIQQADNFIVLVSPHWLSSKICHQELEYARLNNKRVIPVIRREVDIRNELAGIWFGTDWEDLARQNWDFIGKRNWLFFRKRPDADCDCGFDSQGEPLDSHCDGPDCDLDEFTKAFEALVTTIKRDDVYVRKGKDLLTSAKLWEDNASDASYLLRGEELRDAQSWLLHSVDKDPAPTSLHRAFIERSAQNEAQIRSEEDRRLRRLKNFQLAVIGLGVAAAAILVAAIISGIQLQSENVRAESLRLTNAANAILQDPNADTLPAVLLGIKALKLGYSSVAGITLMNSLNSNFEYRAFDGHDGTVTSLAFSPDGRYILSGSFLWINEPVVGKGTIHLWDVSTGSLIRTYGDDSVQNDWIAFSPDEKYVLAGGRDKVILWKTDSGEIVHTFLPNINSPRGSTNYATFNSAAFSPDGAFVIMASSFGIQLFDASSGEFLRSLGDLEEYGQFPKEYKSAYISSTGKYIISSDAQAFKTQVWDASTGDLLREFQGINGAISPNELYVLTTGLDHNTAQIWQLASGDPVTTLIGHTGDILNAVFSPNSLSVMTSATQGFTGKTDNTIRLWDVRTGKNTLVINSFGGAVSSLAFSPDSSYVASGGADGIVHLWTLLGGRSSHVLRGRIGQINSLAISPDSQRLVTGGVGEADNHLLSTQLWNIKSGEEEKLYGLISDEYIGENRVAKVAFSPNGKQIAVASDDVSGDIILWDTATNNRYRSYAALQNDPITGLTYSSDGKYVLAASGTSVLLWDMNGEIIRKFVTDNSIIRSLAYSSDGRFIVAGGGDRFLHGYSAYLWDVASGSLRHTLLGHTDIISGVDIAENNRFVVTGSVDGTARVWDVDSGEMKRLLNLRKTVTGVAFSPDGNLILTIDRDGTATLWDWQQGMTLRTLLGHSAQITVGEFSPDGRYVATGSADGTVRVWDVDYKNFIDYACTQVWRDFTQEERNKFDITDNNPTCPQFGPLKQNSSQAASQPDELSQPEAHVLPNWTSLPTLPATERVDVSPTFTPSPSIVPVTALATSTSSATIEWHLTPFLTPTFPGWTPIASPTDLPAQSNE